MRRSADKSKSSKKYFGGGMVDIIGSLLEVCAEAESWRGERHIWDEIFHDFKRFPFSPIFSRDFRGLYCLVLPVNFLFFKLL